MGLKSKSSKFEVVHGGELTVTFPYLTKVGAKVDVADAHGSGATPAPTGAVEVGATHGAEMTPAPLVV